MDTASVIPERRDALIGCERGEDPTLRLMQAVLAAAVADMEAPAAFPGPQAVHAQVLARQWLESTDRSWPFSFENICDALNLEMGAIRERLLSPDRSHRASRSVTSLLRHVAGRRRKRGPNRRGTARVHSAADQPKRTASAS